MFHLKLGRGATSLKLLVWVAPLFGMLGSAVSLMTAVWAYSYQNCAYGDCSGSVAETLVPFILSLPVTIFASAAFHFLRHNMETFDLEMRTATLDLLNDLVHLLSRAPDRAKGESP